MSPDNLRILVVDDNAAIHEDFRKVLTQDPGTEDHLSRAESLLFGDVPPTRPPQTPYHLDFASQGQGAAHLVQQADRKSVV